MSDPSLFGPWFSGPSWDVWRSFLAALFGLKLEDAALTLYRRHTGRQDPPISRAREAWLVVGRRGGKSIVAALIAVFLSCFDDYTDVLAPGERGVVMIIAADRRQARVVFRYIAGFLSAIPMLSRLIESKTKESIELTNRVTIEVHTGSFRAVRGYTIIAAICDEIAFWTAEDSANPDTEILNGLRPGMATIPDSLLLSISSPYARRGALWQAYREHFGHEKDPVLVWQGETRAMNPNVSEALIAEAYARDEAAASAEYGALFRRDIESFIPREVVEGAIVLGRLELPFASDVQYFAFADPSGGSSDSMTLGIAHIGEHGQAVLDALREVRPPFSPEAVVRDFAALLKSYRVSSVVGDRYGGEWPREQFRKYGIQYVPAEQSKSEIYLELLPAMSSGQVELLDHSRLIAQLCSLERRTTRGGRDSVDHGPGGHDDVVNAAAGVLVLAARSVQTNGLIELWKQQATEIEGRKLSARDCESVTQEEQFKRQADAQMEAARSQFRLGGAFGAPHKTITPLRTVQKVTAAPRNLCSVCGAHLAICGVQGHSGDTELSCGVCGFKEQIPARVVRVRE
jgi:hypothetical protein